jgi:hypothetical protein
LGFNTIDGGEIFTSGRKFICGDGQSCLGISIAVQEVEQREKEDQSEAWF